MSKLSAVSLFSGCGGFDLGLAQAGVDIIWANDIDYHAASAYKSLFKGVEFIHEDIQKISKFPSAEILIGCYPCTGFSEAAKRKWKNRTSRSLLKNPKNFLFKEFLRAIKQVKPKFIFIENVQGMLSAANGYFLNEQLDGLNGLGFEDVHMKLLNSEDYGLAQSRKRVFIVGVHKSVKEFQYKFPDPTHGKSKNLPVKSLHDVIGDMPKWPTGEYSDHVYHGHFLTRNRKRGWNQPSFTIVATASHVPLHPMGEPMIKLGKDHWALQGAENRRLSWRECAVIQGLPIDIQIDGNLNAKYKVVGNSVPPIMAKTVSSPVVEFLNS